MRKHSIIMAIVALKSNDGEPMNREAVKPLYRKRVSELQEIYKSEKAKARDEQQNQSA